MKKAASVILAVLAVLFVFTSCDKKDNGKREQVIGYYSVHSTNKDFMVHFDQKVGAYEILYDENDVHIKLRRGAKILDENGNKIKQSDLNIGDTLIITYDGTLAKDDPKTLEVFEIQRQPNS